VTIDAGDLNGIDILPVQLPIPMAVLGEMAVHTVHAFFEMDILHVDRDTGALFGAISRFTDSALQERPIDRLKGDKGALGIEKIALTVTLEDRLKIPAVAMVVGKLRVLELRVEFRDFGQEGRVSP
jgi:hypothetical protein